jgi:hypothetical protein
VSLWVAVLILVAADLAMAALMLTLRRRAPSGSYFEDTQQAAAVFAVAGTTFAVLVAFTFLLAFQSYNEARDSAQDEATAVQTLFHTSELFAPADRDRLQGELVCYARAVIEREWRTMRDGDRSPEVIVWASRLEEGVERMRIRDAAQAAALSNWLDQNDARQRGRRGRLAQAASLVPPLVWLFLIIGGIVVTAFVFFFADRRERRVAQAGMAVAVTTFVVTSLVMVHFLDSPYTAHEGSVQPSAMRETLTMIGGERAARHEDSPLPCDPSGAARRA